MKSNAPRHEGIVVTQYFLEPKNETERVENLA